MTEAEIRNTVFDSCIFSNGKTVKGEIRDTNFTKATWNSVTFKNSIFGSDMIDRPIIFEQTNMQNVHFQNCTFTNSADFLIDRFKIFNVTFTACHFQGNTAFSMGEVSAISFHDISVRRTDVQETTAGDDAFTFNGVTVYNMEVKDSTFITPIRFESVNMADLTIENTDFDEFWCHSKPEKDGVIKRRAQFNETTFQRVHFKEKVHCDQTKWNGWFVGNTTFLHDADFSDSEVLSIHWDQVVSNSSTGDCHELDFSKTKIQRKIFANVSVECDANFQETTFETVLVKNFYGRRANFEGAIFVRQEYVDGQCCSAVCVPLKCKCNVTDPSGNCPVGGKDVNVSAVSDICFPEDATVRSIDGRNVRMDKIGYGDKIDIGGGEMSEVYFFGHRHSNVESEFVSIRVATSRNALRLSPSHYLYVNGGLRTAEKVQPGDRLRGADGKDSLFVMEVNREKGKGLFAPTSLHGDLLVDGIVVSSYTSAVDPKLAHRLLYPLRMLYRYGMHSVVRRMTMLHERSMAGVARQLGVPRGPDFVLN